MTRRSPGSDHGDMTITTPRSRHLLASLTVVAALLTVSGCSAVTDFLQNQESMEFETTQQLREEGRIDVAWVPDDGVEIKMIATADNDEIASLLVTTTSPLDSEKCAEVQRESAPQLGVEGAPDSYKSTTVFACGNWSVIPSGSGWYGWTPNDADEEAASPQQ